MSGIGSTSGGLRAARPGFTLIEMLVVLAIMSLIAGIGFPAIERTIEVGRFRATATGIGTLLSQAHYAAIREGHDVRVFLGDGGRSITTDGGDSLDIQPPLTLRADDRTVSFHADGSASATEIALVGPAFSRTFVVEPFTGRVASR